MHQPDFISASFWNERYEKRPAFEVDASPFLEMHFKFHHPYHPQGRALDIGCGLGGNARYLAERGYAVTAIDLSEVACQKVAVAATDELLQIVTQATTFEAYDAKERYDMILCLNVLHVQQPESIPKQLEKMKMLTNRGGEILIRTYNHDNDYKHPGLMNLDELTPYFKGWEQLYSNQSPIKSTNKNNNVTDLIVRRR